MAINTNDARVLDALLWRLGQLTLSPALPVAWPDTEFDPGTDGTSGYLAPSWLPAGTTSAAVSGGSRNFGGVFQVSLFLPEARDRGPIVPVDIAGAVAAHFAKDVVIQRPGSPIRVKIEQPPTVEQPVPEQGWTATPVSIPYRAFGA